MGCGLPSGTSVRVDSNLTQNFEKKIQCQWQKADPRQMQLSYTNSLFFSLAVQYLDPNMRNYSLMTKSTKSDVLIISIKNVTSDDLLLLSLEN